eukprot:gnl/TRDRNA2_/TRDRNA2_158133_c1_seq1.p1 gnl/TRDRNA2_/TRDRNA2_158133_c1~~gnl/TRDRNA2_/TRDRNA2_158133_c1_seq1.p1  ORF type:complete len:293 (-),score=63.89 gnl/TRDRNA2_/TRDRNA2_158133_c1_seq1:60-917(-)
MAAASSSEEEDDTELDPSAGPPLSSQCLWPFDKLEAALRADGGLLQGRRPAVVITTGAMNPIHKGHVQMLRQAKMRLEKSGYAVLAGWISPSHDLYVLPKAKSLKTPGLRSAFRTRLAELAVADDAFTSVGLWESAQRGHWPDFPEVVTELQRALNEQFPKLCTGGSEGSLLVFYVCGTDHAKKCGLYRGMRAERGRGVVVVPRDGEEPKGEDEQRLVYVASPASGETATFSSTQLRKAIQRRDGDFVRRAVAPAAARFLLEPSPTEYKEMKADFDVLGVAPKAA